MQISELTGIDYQAWDFYVRRSPGGLPQHLSAWRDVMEDSYGYSTCYLMARQSGRNSAAGHSSIEKDPGRRAAGQPVPRQSEDGPVVGVLPLFLISSVLTGRTLTTMPGGLCADSPDVAHALLRSGADLAKRIHAKQFVVQDSRIDWEMPGRTVSGHEAWLVDVTGTADALQSRLHRNIRRQIRLADRNGLTVTVDREGATLDDFYTVLSHFTHQSGTPVFGRTFLDNTVRCLAGDFNIVTVYQDGTPIGSYFQLEMERTMYGVWGATLHEYLSLRPVYLAYWTILADANRRGFTTVDMGRSPAGSNASKFKKQWGGTSLPIYQKSLSMTGGNHAGITEQTGSSGRLRSFMQIWPKLPYPVTRFLGPKLRRHVPFA